MLATPLTIYCTSVVSFSGWLLIFLACHWNTERHRIGCGQAVQYVCALIRRHTTPQHHTTPHLQLIISAPLAVLFCFYSPLRGISNYFVRHTID
uniref:Secreted protein n=1 Tax=Mesocestoides corti TaxID=53468 RepID=A0A5K3F3W2_MESCO